MEDEKRIIYMKRIITVILSIIKIILILDFIGIFILIFTPNRSETLSFYLGLIGVGSIIYVGNLISVKLVRKQRVEWEAYPKLIPILDGLSVITSLLFGTLFFALFNYFGFLPIFESSSIRVIAELLIGFSFSWWTSLSVAYVRKYATCLFRGYLIVFILCISLGLITNILPSVYINSSVNWNVVFDIILFTLIIATCIKGLSISFSNSWRALFKNQTVPFMLIWVIVAIFFSIIFIANL